MEGWVYTEHETMKSFQQAIAGQRIYIQVVGGFHVHVTRKDLLNLLQGIRRNAHYEVSLQTAFSEVQPYFVFVTRVSKEK